MLKGLASSLDPGRFRSIVCLFHRGWLHEAMRAQDLPTSVIEINRVLDTQWARAFAALVRKERVAVIHAHEFTANTYGSFMGRLLGVPVVATVHGKNYYAEQLKRRLAYRFVSRASQMVTVSEDLKRFIVQEVGVEEHRVSVIYNGVDPTAPLPPDQLKAIRAELRLDEGGLVIGAVGSLYPVKGHIHLIRALPEILRFCPGTVLLLVGRGEQEDALKAEVGKLGLDAYVRFLGFRDDVRVLLSLIDVFVLPSLSEGLSMALLEAMAAGKPVVATRVGGNAELVVEGDTGFLVDPQSPDSISDRVARILRDRTRAAHMGEHGLRRAQNLFSFRSMVEQYQSCYDQATGR